MTTEQQDADVIREAFEKDFFADAPLYISARNRSGDGYEFSIADNAWKTWKRAWQVARAKSPAVSGPSKCKCTFAQKMQGDGCRYCNPQEYIDRLHEALEVEDRGPLTNEQIDDIWVEHGCEGEDANAFARAIEAAHGIGIGIKKEDSNDQ